ncbi:MAG: glycogen/starch synthase, partial [Deltaproteobacteria bacterium]
GKAVEFKGLTTVVFLKPQSGLYEKAQAVKMSMRPALAEAGMTDTLAFVSDDTLHMTVTDIDPNKEGPYADPKADVSEKQFIERFGQIFTAFYRLPQETIKAHVKGIGLKKTVTLLVRFDDKKELEKVLSIDSQLKMATGPAVREIEGHITLAYIVKEPANWEKFLGIMEGFDSSTDLGEFAINPITFCYFPDMLSYLPILTVDIESGEVETLISNYKGFKAAQKDGGAVVKAVLSLLLLSASIAGMICFGSLAYYAAGNTIPLAAGAVGFVVSFIAWAAINVWGTESTVIDPIFGVKNSNTWKTGLSLFIVGSVLQLVACCLLVYTFFAFMAPFFVPLFAAVFFYSLADACLTSARSFFRDHSTGDLPIFLVSIGTAFFMLAGILLFQIFPLTFAFYKEISAAVMLVSAITALGGLKMLRDRFQVIEPKKDGGKKTSFPQDLVYDRYAGTASHLDGETDSIEDFMRKVMRSRYVVGLSGSTVSGIYKEDRDALTEKVDDILSNFPADETVFLANLVDLGGVKLGYDLAEEKGMQTAGISCDLILKKEPAHIRRADIIRIEDRDGSRCSECFTGSLTHLIAFNGSYKTLGRIQGALRWNRPVIMIKGVRDNEGKLGIVDSQIELPALERALVKELVLKDGGEYVEEDVEYFLSIGDKTEAAKCLKSLAKAKEDEKEFKKAFMLSLHAASLFDEIGDAESATGSYARAGHCLFEMKDFLNSAIYGEKAAELSSILSPERAAKAWFLAADSYHKSGEYLKAAFCHEKTAEYDFRAGNFGRALTSLAYIAINYGLAGEHLKCAQAWERVIKLDVAMGTGAEGDSLMNAAWSYDMCGLKEEARRCRKEAVVLMKEASKRAAGEHDYRMCAQFSLLTAELYERIGDRESAIGSYIRAAYSLSSLKEHHNAGYYSETAAKIISVYYPERAAYAWYKAAKSYLKAGDKLNAGWCFRQAAEAELANDSFAQAALAYTVAAVNFDESGRKDDARYCAEKANRLNSALRNGKEEIVIRDGGVQYVFPLLEGKELEAAREHDPVQVSRVEEKILTPSLKRLAEYNRMSAFAFIKSPVKNDAYSFEGFFWAKYMPGPLALVFIDNEIGVLLDEDLKQYQGTDGFEILFFLMLLSASASIFIWRAGNDLNSCSCAAAEYTGYAAYQKLTDREREMLEIFLPVSRRYAAIGELCRSRQEVLSLADGVALGKGLWQWVTDEEFKPFSEKMQRGEMQYRSKRNLFDPSGKLVCSVVSNHFEGECADGKKGSFDSEDVLVVNKQLFAEYKSQGYQDGGASAVRPSMRDAARAYYEAKKEIIETGLRGDRDACGKAYDKLMAANETLKTITPQEAADMCAEIKASKLLEGDFASFIGDPEELLLPSTAVFNSTHVSVIEKSAKEMTAAIIDDPKEAEKWAKEIVSRTAPLTIANFLNDRKVLNDPMFVLGLVQVFTLLAMLKTAMLGGVTTALDEHRILMPVRDDYVDFEASMKHEIVHFLSFMNLMPTNAIDEILTSAVGALERGRRLGPAGLKTGVNAELFELGTELAKKGEIISDPQQLEYYAAGAFARIAAQKGENVAVVNQEMMDRLAGVILAGQALQREKQEGYPALKHILNYGKEIVSLIKPRPLTPEEATRIVNLINEMTMVAQMITGDYMLKVVPWHEMWEGDYACWRYIAEFHELQVVEQDLIRLSTDAARGFFCQEIFRCLFSYPEGMIEPSLIDNKIFCMLYGVAATPWVVRKGLKQYGGARRWLDELYNKHYPKENAEFAKFKMSWLPRHIQFSEALLFEERTGKGEWRVTDEKVKDVLNRSKAVRKEAYKKEREEEFYAVIRDKMWPLAQELMHEDNLDQMLEDEVNNGNVQLPDKVQQQMAKQGGQGKQMKVNNLPKNMQNQVRKQLEDKYNKMTPEQKQQMQQKQQQQGQQVTVVKMGSNMRMPGMPSPAGSQQNQQQGQQQQGGQCQMGQQGGQQQAGQQGQQSGQGQQQGHGQQQGGLAGQAQRIKEKAQQLSQKASEIAEGAQQAEGSAQNLSKDAGKIRQQAGSQAASSQQLQDIKSQACGLKEKSKSLEQQTQEFGQEADKLDEQASQMGNSSDKQSAKDIKDMAGNLKDKAQQINSQAEDLEKRAEELKKQADSLDAQAKQGQGEGQGQDSSLVNQRARSIQEKAKELAEKARQLKEEAKQTEQMAENLGNEAEKIEKGEGKEGEGKGQDQQGKGQDQKGQGNDQKGEGKDQQGQKGQGQQGQGQDQQGQDQQDQQGQPGQNSIGGSGFSRNPWSGRQPNGPQMPQRPQPGYSNPSISQVQKMMNDVAKVLDDEARKRTGLTKAQRDEYKNFVKPVKAYVSTMSRHLKSLIEKNKSEDMQKNATSGEIDEDSLALARARGITFEVPTIPTKVTCYVSLLIDVSGSTVGACLNELILTGLLMEESLKEIPEISSELYAFSTAEAIRLKDYGDKVWTQKIAYDSMRGLLDADHSCTNDTGALMAAAKRIPPEVMRDASVLKVIFIITDGITDKRSVRQVIHQIYGMGKNIRVMGIGAGQGTQNVVDVYFPDGLYVANLKDLPSEFLKLMKKTLTRGLRETRELLLKDGGAPTSSIYEKHPVGTTLFSVVVSSFGLIIYSLLLSTFALQLVMLLTNSVSYLCSYRKELLRGDFKAPFSGIFDGFEKLKNNQQLLINTLAIGIIGPLAYLSAISLLGPQLVSILVVFNGIWALLFAFVFLKEKPTAFKLGGASLAFIGAVGTTIFLKSLGDPLGLLLQVSWLGLLAMLFSTLSYGGQRIFSKNLLNQTSPEDKYNKAIEMIRLQYLAGSFCAFVLVIFSVALGASLFSALLFQLAAGVVLAIVLGIINFTYWFIRYNVQNTPFEQSKTECIIATGPGVAFFVTYFSSVFLGIGTVISTWEVWALAVITIIGGMIGTYNKNKRSEEKPVYEAAKDGGINSNITDKRTPLPTVAGVRESAGNIFDGGLNERELKPWASRLNRILTRGDDRCGLKGSIVLRGTYTDYLKQLLGWHESLSVLGEDHVITSDRYNDFIYRRLIDKENVNGLILDLGAGSAGVGVGLRKAGAANVIALDFSRYALSCCKTLCRDYGTSLERVLAESTVLPFKSESIDSVYTSNMLKYLPPELRKKALAEVWRALKPGGKLYVHGSMEIAIEYSPFYGAVEVETTEWTRKEWEQVFAELGFVSCAFEDEEFGGDSFVYFRIVRAQKKETDGGLAVAPVTVILRRRHFRDWVIKNQKLTREAVAAMLGTQDIEGCPESDFVAAVLKGVGIGGFSAVAAQKLAESSDPMVVRMLERIRSGEHFNSVSTFTFQNELTKKQLRRLNRDFEIIGFAGAGEQYVDVLDEEGNKTGWFMPRRQVHETGEYHSDVCVFAVNRDGKILLQTRSSEKQMYPSLKDASASGHMVVGETPEHAAVNRLREELGIETAAWDMIRISEETGLKIHREFGEDLIENTFTHVFVYFLPEKAALTLRTTEIDGFEFIKAEKLFSQLKRHPGAFAGVKDVLADKELSGKLQTVIAQMSEHVSANGEYHADDVIFRVRNSLDKNGIRNAVLITSEAEPFFKTGGLGDVMGELSTALSNFGLEVTVVTFLYDDIDRKKLTDTGVTCVTHVEYRELPTRIWTAKNGKVTYLFLDESGWFRKAYSGDKLNFAVGLGDGAFNAVAAMVNAGKMSKPQVFHANDWASSLVPVYLKTKYRYQTVFDDCAGVFSIHNAKHTAAWIPGRRFAELGVDGEHWYGLKQPGDESHFCLMRGAIYHADKLNAVSRTNRDEMMTEEGGGGLHMDYRARVSDFLGIPNGTYYPVWEPVTKEDKPARKAAMQAQLGFKVDKDIPFFGMIARLDSQKGVKQVVRVINWVLEETNGGIQFIYLGKGDADSYRDPGSYVAQVADDLKALERRWPNNVKFINKYTTAEQKLAFHAIDIFMYPSEFEPFGTRPIVALINRVPGVVRRTGGLADNFQEYQWATGEGNGWLFENINDRELHDAVWRAINTFRVPEHWEKVTANTVAHDWSWRGPVKEYINMYRWAREKAGLVKQPAADAQAQKKAGEEEPLTAEKLLETLAKDPFDPKTLKSLGAPAVPVLIEALRQTGDVLVSEMIAEHLGYIGHESVPSLIAALKYTDIRFRLAVIQTLDRIGDKRAVEPLKQLALDPSNPYLLKKRIGETLARLEAKEADDVLEDGGLNSRAPPVHDGKEFKYIGKLVNTDGGAKRGMKEHVLLNSLRFGYAAIIILTFAIGAYSASIYLAASACFAIYFFYKFSRKPLTADPETRSSETFLLMLFACVILGVLPFSVYTAIIALVASYPAGHLLFGVGMEALRNDYEHGHRSHAADGGEFLALVTKELERFDVMYAGSLDELGEWLAGVFAGWDIEGLKRQLGSAPEAGKAAVECSVIRTIKERMMARFPYGIGAPSLFVSRKKGVGNEFTYAQLLLMAADIIGLAARPVQVARNSRGKEIISAAVLFTLSDSKSVMVDLFKGEDAVSQPFDFNEAYAKDNFCGYYSLKDVSNPLDLPHRIRGLSDHSLCGGAYLFTAALCMDCKPDPDPDQQKRYLMTAMDYLELALPLDKDCAEIFNYIGLDYRMLDEAGVPIMNGQEKMNAVELELSYFEIAVSLEPFYTDALCNIASALYFHGDFGRAIDKATQAIESGLAADAYITRALAYAEMGERELALGDIEASVKLNPLMAQTAIKTKDELHSRGLLDGGAAREEIYIREWMEEYCIECDKASHFFATPTGRDVYGISGIHDWN